MGRNNSFDLIRHFAALLVLYSHQHALLLLPEPIFLHWDTLGTTAVILFFSISGYFMPGSFTRAGNFTNYLFRRCRRIFPGLIVCSFMMCYLIGGIFTTESSLEYLLSPSTLITSLLYCIFLHKQIPGVFSDFLYKNAINGSLWTLPIEFAYYILLGAVLSLANTWRIVLLLFVVLVFTNLALTFTKIGTLFYVNVFHIHYIALYGIAFTTGSLMAMLQKYWLPFKHYLLFIALISLFNFQGHLLMSLFGTLSLSIIIIVTGISFQDKWIKGRFDLSYGIYIYAFPIQQVVINLISQNFWLSMSISISFTLLIAFLSYKFVEKPFLYNKHSSNQSALSSIPIEQSRI
ncbi:acyltransferase family protein [Legionella cardiaca]|uniref:Acyltransferase n=1 Tax=Legionella cardiaca TaxID=1071983 RepID=A0ABY8AMV9_9GAMM|nr:acyltransferase [Legionella cardiaca]WED41863.1 acyltransferase [Legionella cardiaca]